MKKISLITIAALMSIGLKAQLKDGVNKFETVNIIKKESQIIVITNDSLTIKKISELSISYDCYPCHDSNNGKSMMFTFLSKHESLVLSCCLLDRKNSILVEN
jgi:hypothetical protein